MAGRKKDWLVEVIIYTLAGGVASASVGSALGWLGDWLWPEPVGMVELVAAIIVTLVAAARELGWVSLPLPQWKRQTKDFWGKLFPGRMAALLWGFDLGLIFTTRLTFAGVWLLVVVSILVGEPMFGALLLGLYWLGRALSVWVAPLLMPDASATSWFLDGVYEQYWLFQRIHVLGLVWALVVLIVWLSQGA